MIRDVSGQDAAAEGEPLHSTYQMEAIKVPLMGQCVEMGYILLYTVIEHSCLVIMKIASHVLLSQLEFKVYDMIETYLFHATPYLREKTTRYYLNGLIL